MPDASLSLVELLGVEAVEADVYRGCGSGGATGRVGGGILAAQALWAAGRTVDADRAVHSLHGYFVRPGEPDVPVTYEVARLRDGRSFSTRQVVATQDGRAVLSLIASFHRKEAGLEHGAAMPDVPQPEKVPRSQEVPDHMPFEVRRCDGATEPTTVEGRVTVGQRLWMRARGDLPDDPLVHACAATYLSDLALLDAVLLPHQLGWADPRVRVASLDHAVWFHRLLRADDWLLYDQESPAASGGRGLALGRLYLRDGTHVASVAQECLARML